MCKTNMSGVTCFQDYFTHKADHIDVKSIKVPGPATTCGCVRHKSLCIFCIIFFALIVYLLVSFVHPKRHFFNMNHKDFYSELLDSNTTWYVYNNSSIPSRAICKTKSNTSFQSIFLFVMVESAPTNVLERQTIRDTWGSWIHTSGDAKLNFLLGTVNSTTLQEKISKEAKLYEDLIQDNFVDSYRNLSLKSVGMLRWMTEQCKAAKYLLKSDDDMFIHIPNLIKHLKKKDYRRTILGRVIHGAVPIQNTKSKWYTPKEDFPFGVYPDYTSGTAYVISGDIIPDLYSMALHTEIFWLEDIFVTGILANKIGAKRVHNKGFTYTKRAVDACAYKAAFTGHENTVEDLKNIWKEIKTKKKC